MFLVPGKFQVNLNLSCSEKMVNKVDFKPVFIISEPRSGTTWLQKALNSHGEIFCTEFRLFGDLFDTVIDVKPDGSTRERNRSSLESYIGAISQHLCLKDAGILPREFTDEMTTKIARGYFEYMSEKTGKRFIVDKFTSLPNPEIIKKCKRYFPDASYIYLSRDGRDIAVSKFFDWVTKSKKGEAVDTQSNVYRKYILGEDVELKRLFTDKEIEHFAQSWASHVSSNMASCGLSISYEAMHRDQGKVLENLLEYIGAKFDKELLDHCVKQSTFKVMSGGRQKADGQETAKARSGIAGGWKRYFTKADGEIFSKLCQDFLEKLKLEEDASWVDRLPETINV